MTSETPETPEPPDPREWLRGEIGQWQPEGLVQESQAQALLARYDLLPGDTPRTLRQSRLTHVFAALGAVLVGLGVILLVGANWEGIPKALRLAFLMAVTLGVYHAGFVLAYRRQTYPKLGMALLLIGSLCWGASIFLVGQMFQLTGGGGGGETKAVLYWFLGVLPLAYVLLSPLHMILALVLGCIWFGLALVGGASFQPQALMLCYLGLGVLLYASGRLHAERTSLKHLEAPWRWLGLLSIFSILYAFSFRGSWESFFSSQGNPVWLWPGALLALAVAAVVLLLLGPGRRSPVTSAEAGALLGLLLLGALTAALHPAWFASGDEFSHYGEASSYLAMPLSNLLLFAAVISVIALGWARNQSGLVTFGLFVFFVQVVTRYFDLFGGMLSGGLLFIGAGLLLLGAGWGLEYSRRKLLRAMAERGAT